MGHVPKIRSPLISNVKVHSPKALHIAAAAKTSANLRPEVYYSTRYGAKQKPIFGNLRATATQALTNRARAFGEAGDLVPVENITTPQEGSSRALVRRDHNSYKLERAIDEKQSLSLYKLQTNLKQFLGAYKQAYPKAFLITFSIMAASSYPQLSVTNLLIQALMTGVPNTLSYLMGEQIYKNIKRTREIRRELPPNSVLKLKSPEGN